MRAARRSEITRTRRNDPRRDVECSGRAIRCVRSRVSRRVLLSKPVFSLANMLADDDGSISQLSKTTSSCFDIDKVRLLYIRAQVTRIDLKIDLALCEVQKRYKKLIRRATGTSYAIGGATINRKVSTNNVTKAVINCFGLPSVSADVAVEALKSTVWKTWGTNSKYTDEQKGD